MAARSLYFIRILGVAFAYAILAKVALSYFSSNGAVSIVWPASGLALAALIIGGKKYWPAILIGAFFANSFNGDHFIEAATIAIGNTFAAFVSFSLLSHYNHLSKSLLEFRHFLWIGISGAIGSLAAAIIGVFAIVQANVISINQVAINLLHWWQGDTLGIILIAPLILVWQKLPQGWFSRLRIVETVACFGLAFIAGQIIFIGWLHEFFPLARGFWMFIFVTWAALRFGRHGALLIISMTASQVLIGTIKVSGLFSNDFVEGGLLNSWFYILTLSIIGITLSLVFERDIKLRKAAQESIEERLRLATESGQVAVWEVDLKTNKLTWDDTCFKLYKIDKENFKNTFEEWRKCLYLPDIEKTITAFQRAVSGGDEYKPEFRIVWPNGEIRYIEGHGKVIHDEAGIPVRMIGTNWDITRLKEAEAISLKNEERLKLGIASSRIGIWEYNLRTHQLIWDGNMYGLYDIKREHFSNTYDEWTKLLHPEDMAKVELQRSNAVNDIKEYETEFRIIRPDGGIHYIKERGNITTNKAGRPISIIGTNWDNWAYTHSQQQLELAHTAIDKSKTAFIWLTTDGKVSDVNNFACISLGYSHKELTSLSVWDFDPNFPPPTFKKAQEDIRKKESVIFESNHKRKDGTAFPVEITANYIHLNENEFIFCSVQDISIRKQSEDALAHSEQRYKLLNEIGEKTRLLTEPDAILSIITELLGSHLNVSRCAYAEVEEDGEHVVVLGNYVQDCPSILGRHQLSLFGSYTLDAMQAGKTLVIDDIENTIPAGEGLESFVAMNVNATIGCPLIKQGKLQAIIGIQHISARQWTDKEVGLTKEVAEHCWAIIERAKAEKERNKLSDIIERSVNEVLLLDVETLKFSYANQAARKNLGYTMQQLQTMSPADIKTEFDESAFREMLAPLVERNVEKVTFEGIHRRANNSTFPVEVQLQLADMTDETQILAFIQDISNRKQSEDALAVSEKRLRFLNELGESTRTLLEPQEVLTTITNLLGKHLNVSRSAYATVEPDSNHFTIPYNYTNNCENMLGDFTLSQFGTFAASQLQSGKVLILNNADIEIPPENLAAFNAVGIKAIICWPLIKEGVLRAMMAVHQTTAREWTLDEIALVQEVVERCWAIIERTRAEKERTELADIIERSSNEILIFDAKTLFITYANEGARQNLGYSLDELMSMTVVDIKPESYKKSFPKTVKPLLNRKVNQLTFETMHQRADGTVYPSEIQLQLADQEGKQVLAFVQDMSERERVKDELITTQTAIENSQTSFFKLNSEGYVTYVNQYACSSLGYTKDELVGMHVTDFDPDFPAEAWKPMWKDLQKNKIVKIETRHQRKDGTIFAVEIVGNMITSEGENYSFTFAQDITQRKRAEESLRLAASVYENSSEAMTVSDPDGIIITVNPAFTKITGFTPEEVIGKNRSMLSSGRHDEEFYRAMWDEINTTGHWQGEVLDRRKSGVIYPAWLTINTIFNDDKTPYRRISLFSDSTAWKETEALIWHQANFDALTELPNRQMFHDRLQQDIKKAYRANQSLALMFLDLDRFKEINDSLGHDIGDSLLKEAATRIKNCVRDADTVARLGGDEFTIILDDFDKDDGGLDRIAQDILNSIAEPFQLKEEVGYVTASIGITLYPQDATDIDGLIKNADQAMYAAKNQGRNRYSYFTPSMQKRAQVRTRMANDLRSALKNNEFWLAYQPIIELSTGDLFKAEALLRWQHPKLGLISPVQFIPVAEHTGLICEIGEWAFHESLSQVKAWQTKYKREFQISVNVSPVQIYDKSNKFKPWQAQLRKAKLAGKSIIVEITEGLLLEADSATNEKLLEFRDAGIQVALDDFGTGYSSLSYLKKFDIDYIKIDQSFVRGLTHSTGDLALCEAMIVMAHKLDMKVIAEGVETNAQQDLLKQIGCDFAQGYLISKPVPASEFELLLMT